MATQAAITALAQRADNDLVTAVVAGDARLAQYRVKEFTSTKGRRLPQAALFAAARSPNPELLELLLDSFEVNEHDANGDTALHHAVRSGGFNQARQLLCAGANHRLRNRELCDAMFLAVARQDVPMQQLLFQHDEGKNVAMLERERFVAPAVQEEAPAAAQIRAARQETEDWEIHVPMSPPAEEECEQHRRPTMFIDNRRMTLTGDSADNFDADFFRGAYRNFVRSCMDYQAADPRRYQLSVRAQRYRFEVVSESESYCQAARARLRSMGVRFTNLPTGLVVYPSYNPTDLED
jgi:hypothetical protein